MTFFVAVLNIWYCDPATDSPELGKEFDLAITVKADGSIADVGAALTDPEQIIEHLPEAIVPYVEGEKELPPGFDTVVDIEVKSIVEVPNEPNLLVLSFGDEDDEVSDSDDDSVSGDSDARG